MKANALLRSCVGKKPYSYKAALRRIADKQKEGVNLRWYPCENCQRIHLTKRDVEQPNPPQKENTARPEINIGRVVLPKTPERPRYTPSVTVKSEPEQDQVRFKVYVEIARQIYPTQNAKKLRVVARRMANS